MASRLGLKRIYSISQDQARSRVACGVASRLGLKLSGGPLCQIRLGSGLWSGFPPGIEILAPADLALLVHHVACGVASRLRGASNSFIEFPPGWKAA